MSGSDRCKLPSVRLSSNNLTHLKSDPVAAASPGDPKVLRPLGRPSPEGSIGHFRGLGIRVAKGLRFHFSRNRGGIAQDVYKDCIGHLEAEGIA